MAEVDLEAAVRVVADLPADGNESLKGRTKSGLSLRKPANSYIIYSNRRTVLSELPPKSWTD